MPTLPRYDMKTNVAARPISPMMQGQEQSLDAVKKLGDTLGGIADQFRQANDVMEYTKFKANAETEVATIKAAANNDPNENNVKAHLDALDKTRDKLLSGFSNKMAESKAALDLDNSLAVAKLDIEGSFQKKKLLTNEIALDQTVKMLAQKRHSAASKEEQAAADKEMLDIIKANINSGTITQAGGSKRLDDYRLGHVDLAIMNDGAISKDQSYVYQQIKAGKEGDYPDLTDAERADRLEKTELHIRRNKYLSEYGAEVNQTSNEKDLLLKQGSNAVSEGDVRNFLISTGIRKDFGEDFIKQIYTPPAQETEHAAYNKIKMAQLNGKSEKEINKLVVANIGLLTTTDREKILNASYNPLDSRTITIKASAEALKNWADKSFTSLVLGDLATNEIVFNFLQRVEAQPDGKIDEIMQGVQKDYIRKTHPDTTLLPDVPNIIGNRNKIISVYKNESKAQGKKVDMKPLDPKTQTMTVDFNDL